MTETDPKQARSNIGDGEIGEFILGMQKSAHNPSDFGDNTD